MDRVHYELVVPLLFADRHREAADERLLALAAAQSVRRPPVAQLGALLIRAGTRLEALGAPAALPLSSAVAADACRLL